MVDQSIANDKCVDMQRRDEKHNDSGMNSDQKAIHFASTELQPDSLLVGGGQSRSRQSVNHAEMSLGLYSSQERIQLGILLEPVREHLEKLKSVTASSLPAYNPRVRSKQYAQVLNSKLLPVGKFILELLQSVPDQDRGCQELKLCRYIAVEYWPSALSPTVHLRIQEAYRNAIFLSGYV